MRIYFELFRSFSNLMTQTTNAEINDMGIAIKKRTLQEKPV